MITPLGRFIRRIRIDRGLLLYDMARDLNVSVVFLSRVENGKEGMPDSWRNEFVNLYSINEDEVNELNKLTHL